MNIPSNILTMLAGIALTLISIWYGQNHGLMPVEASEDAVLVDGLFNTMMVISTAIFLLVEGVLVFCIIKFRRRPGDETDGPPMEGNIPLEIVWTAIPVIIVLVIGVYSFDVYNSMGGFDPEAADSPELVQVAMLPGQEGSAPMLGASQSAHQHPLNLHHNHMALGIGATPEEGTNPADLTVNVLGLQYAWIFTYPDYGVTTGELHIPAGKDIKLVMKAQDVIHAFWLPEFRLKQDTIPGQDSELRFVPNRVGSYPIVCAELCGPYHGGMRSVLHVEEPDDFDQWLQAQIPPSSEEGAAGEPVAANLISPENRTDDQFLAPFADQIGVDAKVLNQLQTPHQAHPLLDSARADSGTAPQAAAKTSLPAA